MTEIRIPDIGDAENVEVIELCAAPGERVGADDAILVIESDKASMEVPAGVTGVLDELLVAVGDAVSEGQPIARVSGVEAPDEGASGATASESDLSSYSTAYGSGTPSPIPEPSGEVSAPESGERRAGATSDTEAKRERMQASHHLAPANPPGSEKREKRHPGASVYAGPATRRLARELGVNLSEVRGTGVRGRIVKSDIKQFVKQALTAPARDARRGSDLAPVPSVDFARFGPVETKPLTRVRAVGARNLRASWLNIPHVTHHDEVDVTELEELRRSLTGDAAERNIKLTPLPFIVMACCDALLEFPTFNASLDANADDYVLKRYYNIGVAVDSEQGLVVPVLKKADRKGIWELAREIGDLAAKVRDRRLGLNDTQGGTFSVSSLGALGGTGFTPIINTPEVAILGVARMQSRPVWDGSGFRPRKMLPLSLSYDHRAINGAEAGRFIRFLADRLNRIGYLDL